MVSVFASSMVDCGLEHSSMVDCGLEHSSMVDCGLEHWSGQTKDNSFGVCCFFAKHITLRSKSQNQDKVSEWSDMSLSADCELVSCKNPT